MSQNYEIWTTKIRNLEFYKECCEVQKLDWTQSTSWSKYCTVAEIRVVALVCNTVGSINLSDISWNEIQVPRINPRMWEKNGRELDNRQQSAINQMISPHYVQVECLMQSRSVFLWGHFGSWNCQTCLQISNFWNGPKVRCGYIASKTQFAQSVVLVRFKLEVLAYQTGT